jgi:hypothetical protein
MLGSDTCDKAIDVLAHEDGVLLIGPDGLSFAVTMRAAEESAARLLKAVEHERSRQRYA